MANQEDPIREAESSRKAMIGDWSTSGDFFGAILAALLLGFLADRIFGTGPLFVVLGAVAGFAVGFWRMYQVAKAAEEEELRRRSQRPHP